jgi:HD-like signal output (HDOD) protein
MILYDDGDSSIRVLLVGQHAKGDDLLETALSEQGLAWEIIRVDDAQAALALSSQHPVDVIVTDARIGPTDGTSLLAAHRQQHPGTVRILLLDEASDPPDTAMLETAHRILNHPLRADELVETVDGVVELRELLDSAELKAFVGSFARLPPPPELYLELSRALNDPECTTARIINLVSKDPAIAARVLRLCNSAYFSGGRTFTDLRSAVIRLGAQNLRRLVLASEVFGESGSGLRVDREALQQRAMASSQLAAQLLGDASADLAATACLLAEVGKLLPGVETSEPGDAPSGNSPGPCHAEAGAYLLGLWGLPLPIVEAVANQNRPGRSGHRGFWVTGAVHVARALVCGWQVDEAYLASVSMLDRLPAWRALVESESEERAQAV